jgi:hypothetical protein
MQYYLDDSISMRLSKDQMSSGDIYFSDYEITTDESIIPLKMEKIEAGGYVSDPLYRETYPKLATDNTYANFTLRKSRRSRIVKRHFLKLNEVFGLIGGLFGSVSIFLFFVKSYNNQAYLFSIASTLYTPSDNT